MYMGTHYIYEQYFHWMCGKVYGFQYSGPSYQKLLTLLNKIPFTYLFEMDGNRADDGIALRNRFGHETEFKNYYILFDIMPEPCSVLEMMVALAIRCEEHIMDNPEIGNRTSKWFWTMIDNLGLTEMDDSDYSQPIAEMVIQRFLEHEYARDGRGGLFAIPGTKRDMRNADIWYQMMWYLCDVLNVGHLTN